MKRLLACSLLFAGCSAADVRGARVLDGQLAAEGRWTDRDARARALLDEAAPPDQDGRWPVRLAPARNKLVTEVRGVWLPRVGIELLRPEWERVSLEDVTAAVGRGPAGSPPRGLAGVLLSAWVGTFTSGALDAVLGQDHEARYTYVPRAGAWVVLARDAPPCVIGEELGAEPVLTREDAPPAAFGALRLELQRDVEGVLGVTP